ncbi:MAG: TIGR00159 family protein, partial [Paraprevotella sp.]|nr:TIGR00159 family protein [Paraprevotella sp.]
MLEMGIKDVIDVLLVAVILFYCYKLMKQSRSVNIFYGVLVFVSFWIIISKVLEMKLLGNILNQLVGVGAIAIIVLFQEEIRHFFYSIGAHQRARKFIHLFRPDKRKG